MEHFTCPDIWSVVHACITSLTTISVALLGWLAVRTKSADRDRAALHRDVRNVIEALHVDMEEVRERDRQAKELGP